LSFADALAHGTRLGRRAGREFRGDPQQDFGLVLPQQRGLAPWNWHFAAIIAGERRFVRLGDCPTGRQGNIAQENGDEIDELCR
jgi:hypothetical protein